MKDLQSTIRAALWAAFLYLHSGPIGYAMGGAKLGYLHEMGKTSGTVSQRSWIHLNGATLSYSNPLHYTAQSQWVPDFTFHVSKARLSPQTRWNIDQELSLYTYALEAGACRFKPFTTRFCVYVGPQRYQFESKKLTKTATSFLVSGVAEQFIGPDWSLSLVLRYRSSGSVAIEGDSLRIGLSSLGLGTSIRF